MPASDMNAVMERFLRSVRAEALDHVLVVDVSRERPALPGNHPGAEKSYLFRVAANRAAHARRTVVRRREEAIADLPDPIDWSATPETLTDQKIMRELLDRILEQMDESLRAPLVLCEFEGMTTAEIADLMEIPRGTVASRLRRARGQFRERVVAIDGVERDEPFRRRAA